MSTPVSDLDILLYVWRAPDHRVDADALRAFIGENAARRLSELRHAHMIKSTASWFSDSGPACFTLDSEGERLVSAAEQRAQEKADQRAEAYREKRAKREEAILDQKKSHRHDFKVAVFSAVLALFLEHIPDIVKLVKEAINALAALFAK